MSEGPSSKITEPIESLEKPGGNEQEFSPEKLQEKDFKYFLLRGSCVLASNLGHQDRVHDIDLFLIQFGNIQPALYTIEPKNDRRALDRAWLPTEVRDFLTSWLQQNNLSVDLPVNISIMDADTLDTIGGLYIGEPALILGGRDQEQNRGQKLGLSAIEGEDWQTMMKPAGTVIKAVRCFELGQRFGLASVDAHILSDLENKLIKNIPVKLSDSEQQSNPIHSYYNIHKLVGYNDPSLLDDAAIKQIIKHQTLLVEQFPHMVEYAQQIADYGGVQGYFQQCVKAIEQNRAELQNPQLTEPSQVTTNYHNALRALDVFSGSNEKIAQLNAKELLYWLTEKKERPDRFPQTINQIIQNVTGLVVRTSWILEESKGWGVSIDQCASDLKLSENDKVAYGNILMDLLAELPSNHEADDDKKIIYILMRLVNTAPYGDQVKIYLENILQDAKNGSSDHTLNIAMDLPWQPGDLNFNFFKKAKSHCFAHGPDIFRKTLGENICTAFIKGGDIKSFEETIKIIFIDFREYFNDKNTSDSLTKNLSLAYERIFRTDFDNAEIDRNKSINAYDHARTTADQQIIEPLKKIKAQSKTEQEKYLIQKMIDQIREQPQFIPEEERLDIVHFRETLGEFWAFEEYNQIGQKSFAERQNALTDAFLNQSSLTYWRDSGLSRQKVIEEIGRFIKQKQKEVKALVF